MRVKLSIWAGVILALFTSSAFAVTWNVYPPKYIYNANANLYIVEDNSSDSLLITSDTVEGVKTQYCNQWDALILQYLTDHFSQIAPPKKLEDVNKVGPNNEIMCEALFQYNTSDVYGVISYKKPTSSYKYNNAGNWYVWNDGSPAPVAFESCPIDLEHGVSYDAGTYAVPVQPDTVVNPLCHESCNFYFDGKREHWETGVDPKIADQYGCTFDQDGYISGCPGNTPIRVWINYFSDGSACSAATPEQSISVPEAASDKNADIVNAINETNNLLQQIKAGQGVGTDMTVTNSLLSDINNSIKNQSGSGTDMTETNAILNEQKSLQQTTNDNLTTLNNTLSKGGESYKSTDELIDQDAEFIGYQSKINAIGSGEFKPFGSGLDSLYPNFEYSGTCPLTDFSISILGYSAVVDMVQYCDYFQMIISIFDLVLYLSLLGFIYNQFVLAMRDA